MLKTTRRLTIYLEPAWIRAIRIESARRGISASALLEEKIIKDRKLAAHLPASERGEV